MKIFKKSKSKLSRRITWRVLVIVSIINLFIIGAILLFDLAMSRVNSEMRAQHVIDGMEGKLEAMVQVVKAVAFNNRVEVEANLESPEKVFDALERELRVNKHLLGCFAAFEPAYYKKYGRWFEAYAYYTDSTHIERQQIGSSHHDYFNGVWYQKGVSLERDDDGYLTDPYFDDTVDSSMYCSYVLPIFDRQGRKVGVYGVDLNLDWMYSTIINEEKKVKKMGLIEYEPEGPDDPNVFFIQIIDSKGQKIVGSENMDEKTLNFILENDHLNGKSLKINDRTYFVNTKRIARTGWTLAVAQHWQWVYADGFLLGGIIIFFMTIGGIIIFFFMSRGIRRATKPLGFLSESAKEVAKGNFDTALPSFKHNDEVAQLRDSFDTMQQSLKSYVAELKETTASKATIESELNIAHSIQMSMLPKTFPPFPTRNDIDIFGQLTPAKAIGGDLFDFFIRDENLFFCIGDVSGKGVPASLVMAVTRTLFRNIAAHTALPSHIAETMNTNLSEGNDNNMFVTLFVGVLDLTTGHLRYCNAGHDSPYIQNVLLPCDPNLPLGVMPDMKYSEQETELTSGTTLFLYTDGLTEAENAVHELFGGERVAEMINTFTADALSPQKMVEIMADAVHQFVGDTEQSDDLTLLAIRYTK